MCSFSLEVQEFPQVRCHHNCLHRWKSRLWRWPLIIAGEKPLVLPWAVPRCLAGHILTAAFPAVRKVAGFLGGSVQVLRQMQAGLTPDTRWEISRVSPFHCRTSGNSVAQRTLLLCQTRLQLVHAALVRRTRVSCSLQVLFYPYLHSSFFAGFNDCFGSQKIHLVKEFPVVT